MKRPFYPIVYVRGYASTDTNIESVVESPYMGFNLGSTKVRQKHDGSIEKHIFESPLMRLIKDHGYVDTFQEGGVVEKAPAKSIWIYRYYDSLSEDVGNGERLGIQEFAKGLDLFLKKVRQATCATAQERKRFKVYLVAHSMGGLICRSYLQKISRDNHQVDKVFTFGTPHNGIDFFGLNVPYWGPFQSGNFNRDKIKEDLGIPRTKPANSLCGHFPEERFCCLIGTNSKDYTVQSKNMISTMSDGLVATKNAHVEGASRCYLHLSHSGPYGMVNSEEGYQALQRFLFGDYRIKIEMVPERIRLPKTVQTAIDSGKNVKGVYYVDVDVRMRGFVSSVYERRKEQGSAIFRQSMKSGDAFQKCVLYTGFLSRQLKRSSKRDLSFSLQFRVSVPEFEVEKKLWFDDQFPGSDLVNDSITFSLTPLSGGLKVGISLRSQEVLGKVLRPKLVSQSRSRAVLSIPFGPDRSFRSSVAPSLSGLLRVQIDRWNHESSSN